MPLSTVSVVIPAFNAASTIRRALESVFQQSTRPYLVVVVDDGSTDATAAVVREYGSSVRYVRQENAGAAVARNRGVEASESDCVAFLDADDEWLPAKLDRQLAILREHPELDWCFCHMEGIRGGRPDPVRIAGDVCQLLAKAPKLPFFVAASRGLSLGTSGLLLRRRVFAALGGFDPSLRVSEDRELWWRIAKDHRVVGYSTEVLWRYHVETPGSLTKDGRDRTDGLRAVCRTLRAWRNASDSGFEAFGRRLALEYLIREAMREVTIERRVTAEAHNLISLTVSERVRLVSLQGLPSPLAQAAGRRWLRQ